MLEIGGNTLPVEGARQIHTVGTLVFKCASEKKTFQHKDLVLEKGAKVTAGPIPFEVTRVNPTDKSVSIKLRATQDLDSVADIKFYDADGKEIKASGLSGITARSAEGKTVSATRGFSLKKKVDKVTLSITYWMDLKIVEVPFDVKASLGL